MNSIQALILSGSFLVAVGVAASSFKNRNRPNDLIQVTGLAKADFESDLVVWNGRFVQRHVELKKAYELLKQDAEKVQGFASGKGIAAAEMTVSSVTIDKEFESIHRKDGSSSQQFKGFVLTQNVRVESKEIDKIEGLSRDISALIDAGVEFYSNPVEYYYTKLGELKIEMIAAATKDGRMRAEKISENAGGKIGALRYSSLGVFQINRPNSSAETSWEGSFDTSSRLKSATVTIRLQFGIES